MNHFQEIPPMFPRLPEPRFRHVLGALFVCLFALAAVTHAATLPAGFTETRVTGGLSNPTAMAFAPDGRIFVAQQGGQLRVIKNGTLLATPFLTVTVSSSGERGLLGVELDPDFSSNGFVYIYYTATTPTIHNRVSRFTASGDTAVPGSETVILELNNLSGATNHNGGALHFGPDGKLYVAAGENANGSNAQTLGNLLGKILRINKDGSIPSDNPFFSTASGVNRAIWALGLRNPFTFSFQPGTGRMLINDVGQNTWEEINEGIAGSNYGWPSTEGPTSNPAFRGPIYLYGHGNGSTTGCAITGGAFYNPATQQFPDEYEGSYFFADFCSGWIRRIDPSNPNAASAFATGIGAPVDLRVTDDGSLYYLARQEGAVYRVRATATNNAPPTAAIFAPPNRALYRAGDTIQYNGGGMDPEDGDLPSSALTWRVDFHHDGRVDPFIPSTSGAPGGSFTIPTRGETSTNVFYRIHLTVRDSGGLAASTFVDIVPRTSTVSLGSEPAGLRLTIDGQIVSQAVIEGVVGMIRTIGVISPQTYNGIVYEFESWSDGGAATHEITIQDTPTAYTARFRAIGTAPGLGLLGTYYNNLDFTGAARTRLDRTVNFEWPGRPVPGIGADTFSVRWTGRVVAKVTGLYTFTTQSDDGVRLWVDGVQLVDHWTDGTSTNSGTIELVANQSYDIRMEQYDRSGGAMAKLLWSAPGVAQEVVPQSHLHPYALLIAGSATLGAADEAVRIRLEEKGYAVLWDIPSVTTAAKADGKALLLISSTIRDVALGTRFRNVITPIVTWETHQFDDLGMTRAAAGSFGVKPSQRRLDIARPAHPLAAGLSGRVAVTTAPAPFAWGKPAASAVVVARLTGEPDRAAIFGYERGTAMVGLTAPGRRVGLFLGDATAGSLTPRGWALFDAAVRWASGAANP
jgi:glucose/arabinose dehydrogenase